jgi:quercetin dioxygenase-like cupin family protein
MPTVLLRSEQSGGEVSVIDVTAPTGFPGPPLHTHDFDEAFYVVEGELTFQVEDPLVTKGAGELAFAPRNVPHTLSNRSGAPARYVLVCTPAGFERYFARMEAERRASIRPSGRWATGPRSRASARGSGSDGDASDQHRRALDRPGGGSSSRASR